MNNISQIQKKKNDKLVNRINSLVTVKEGHDNERVRYFVEEDVPREETLDSN